MKTKLLYAVVALGMSTPTFAQVTKVGNDTLLDVAGWNVEWFGDATAGNGPSDEALQYANVKSVIKNTDIDVWGLAEVSNPTTFTNLLTDLTAYDGVLSSFSQTQKTACIWKKEKFKLISSGNILLDQSYYYDFASGRTPLEIALETKGNAITDTLYFYVLHLKANSGSGDQASYTRRKNAVGYLKTYLDTNKKGKKCFVLGDWNDDVDQSVVYISPAYLESPFLNFVNDSSHYFFTSMALSKAGENSYVSSQNMIDHQLITRYVKDSFYVGNSAMVMKSTAGQISGYSNNTSDHYPVLSRYNLNRYIKPIDPPTGIADLPVADELIAVYPNPATQMLHLEMEAEFTSVSLWNMIGEVVITSREKDLDVSFLSKGIYTLVVTGKYGTLNKKVSIQH